MGFKIQESFQNAFLRKDRHSKLADLSLDIWLIHFPIIIDSDHKKKLRNKPGLEEPTIWPFLNTVLWNFQDIIWMHLVQVSYKILETPDEWVFAWLKIFPQMTDVMAVMQT